jgi:hypothetical protein
VRNGAAYMRLRRDLSIMQVTPVLSTVTTYAGRRRALAAARIAVFLKSAAPALARSPPGVLNVPALAVISGSR